MNRRGLLTTLAAGSAYLLSGCATPGTRSTGESVAGDQSIVPPPSAVADHETLTWSLPTTKAPRPETALTALPGRGRYLALTVDDGASSEVVGAYARFAKDSGARFTFFVTGSFPAWRDNRAELLPLVESGQVQLANHTWTHPDLTSLSSSAVAEELRMTQNFLRRTYGVDGTPYYRPPFGFHNDAVDAVAADLGYTTPALWYGSLSDSGLITTQYLVQCARKYFRAQAIVIGHANHRPVTQVYPKLLEIIRRRNLSMVTLNDYFEK